MKRPDDGLARAVNMGLLLLILLSVVIIVLQSFQTLASQWKAGFEAIEAIISVLFTIEYLARIWTADLKYPDTSAGKARMRHCATPMALIDLAAILPFYLPMFLPVDLRFMRILRLTRLLRILKLNRYSRAMTMIGNVIRKKKEELASSLFIMGLVLLLSSIFMYYVENPAQPGAFPNIPAAMWWAICTLTTVGYGDLYPITVLGRLLAAVITIIGIGLIALPTAIISSGFLEQLRGEDTRVCPHCGKQLTAHSGSKGNQHSKDNRSNPEQTAMSDRQDD